MAINKIRRLHQSDGAPDCPVCLDDILKKGLEMSKDCAILEVENSKKVRLRVSRAVVELKALVKEFEYRMRYEVAPEVEGRPHRTPNKGFPKNLRKNK